MVRVKCAHCGQIYPKGAGHRCGDTTPTVNDNLPFDPKAWRRTYMREYMRRLRERRRQDAVK